MAKRRKVTVVGAGNVGATCAQRIVEHDVADVVLIDIVEGLAQGKALDIMQSAPILGFRSTIQGTSHYRDTKDSDIIVITAGLARKPGMSRDDLLMKNGQIVKSIVQKVGPHSPKASIIIVTNPLDVMCAVALRYAQFPHQRIIGMAGELDRARFSHCIRMKTSASVRTINSVVLGTHGDLMVPVTRLSRIGKNPITKIFSRRALTALVDRTKKGGAEIVQLLKSGSAYYAPSAAAFKMVKIMLEGRDDIVYASVYLRGEYGINDMFCGVPVQLDKKGVRKVIKLALNDVEKKMLQASAQAIQQNVAKLEEWGILS